MKSDIIIETEMSLRSARKRPRAGVFSALGSFFSNWGGWLTGLAIGLAAGWVVLPELLYERQDQPMDFNHALHMDDAGMACGDCHGLRGDGSFSGIPALAVCEDCHAEVQGESPMEAYLVAEYIEPGREIPWLSYWRQPQNVYFSHAAHIELAGIDCARCHGDHGTTTTLPVHQVNKLSTYNRNIWGPRIAGGGPRISDSMKMSDCSECHAGRGVADHCLMCHR